MLDLLRHANAIDMYVRATCTCIRAVVHLNPAEPPECSLCMRLLPHPHPCLQIYDALMHVKLLVALATARCCPSPGWLARQQETLARALAGDESDVLDAETAAQVGLGVAADRVVVMLANARARVCCLVQLVHQDACSLGCA
jgi:hypothetical protein